MHVSLDQALGRQPRLNRLGDKLLQIADGAAAAYSLRSLTGNGGNAVKVRRTSDNVEVDVGFDGSGVVSDTSPITNVTESPDAGDTTASTLGVFITEDTITEESDFSSDADSYVKDATGQQPVRVASFEGESNVIKYDHDAGRSGIRKVAALLDNSSSYTITFKYYAPASYDGKFFAVERAFTTNTSTENPVEITSGSWQTASISITAGNILAAGYFALRVQDTAADGLGTTTLGIIYFKDFVITATTSGGSVVTWYDQSGNSNDATQDTAGNQPLIAEGGILKDHLDFDGGNKRLNHVDSGSTTAASVFSVVTRGTNTTSGARPVGYSEVSSSVGTFSFSMDNRLRFDGATAGPGTQTIPATDSFVSTMIKVSNTEAKHFLDGASNIDNSSLTLTDTDLTYSIGRAGTGTAFDGTVKEAVFFNSDQSSNRSDIETNIASHYNITLA